MDNPNEEQVGSGHLYLGVPPLAESEQVKPVPAPVVPMPEPEPTWANVDEPTGGDLLLPAPGDKRQVSAKAPVSGPFQPVSQPSPLITTGNQPVIEQIAPDQSIWRDQSSPATDDDSFDQQGWETYGGASAGETTGTGVAVAAEPAVSELKDKTAPLTKKEKKPKKKRTGAALVGSWVREIAIVVVGALVASTLLRLFVVQLYEIPSESMANLLQTNDRVAVQKISGFQRGDVVVFKDTKNWLHDEPVTYEWWQQALVFVGLAPDESVGYLIKRVIGLPGDRVTCCDAQGRVSVNGYSLDETSYLFKDPMTAVQSDPSRTGFDVTVPKGQIFVLGDHRNDSLDSRCHLTDGTGGAPQGSNGFIPEENVVGSAAARVFPFDRFSGISRPPIFDSIPAPEQPPPEVAIIHAPIVPCVSE